MMNILMIGAGGALGAISRHYLGQLALRTIGSGQPWGTLSVNIIGGLLMGMLVGWLAATERADANSIRLLAAVGFLGGFTTFSAFSLEMVRMLETRAWMNAFAYAAGSVILSVGAVMVGLMIMRKVWA